LALAVPIQAPRTSKKPAKLPPSFSLETPHQPSPPPLPSSPEKFIQSQVHDLQSLPSIEAGDSAAGDSSLSSNPNLSPQNSSDASFTDEEAEESGSERVRVN
jgi:hypothetical protein